MGFHDPQTQFCFFLGTIYLLTQKFAPPCEGGDKSVNKYIITSFFVTLHFPNAPFDCNITSPPETPLHRASKTSPHPLHYANSGGSARNTNASFFRNYINHSLIPLVNQIHHHLHHYILFLGAALGNHQRKGHEGIVGNSFRPIGTIKNAVVVQEP